MCETCYVCQGLNQEGAKYLRNINNNQHVCEDCGKRYRWKNTLQRHIQSECRKEPAHACPHCSYRAKQRGNLQVHIRKYHTLQENVISNSNKLYFN